MAEPVSVSTSHDCAAICIQVPISEIAWPAIVAAVVGDSKRRERGALAARSARHGRPPGVCSASASSTGSARHQQRALLARRAWQTWRASALVRSRWMRLRRRWPAAVARDERRAPVLGVAARG